MKKLHWEKDWRGYYRAENIKECNPEYDGPVVTLELRYQYSDGGQNKKGWMLIRKDADGDQLGEGWLKRYKADAIALANVLLADYNLEGGWDQVVDLRTGLCLWDIDIDEDEYCRRRIPGVEGIRAEFDDPSWIERYWGEWREQ